jgi:HAD superfamily hydrolase (TIGR01484 family)
MIFFSDFDGTLTTEGKLTREFFTIMELIAEREAELVIVSGRSLSWGHFLLTHFPLRACIMEGGGVIVYRNEQGEIAEEPLVSQEELLKLRQFSEQLTHHYPHIPLSADSFGRKTDRAIEFHLMEEKWIDEVMHFMDREGINYSKSNVHINFWCGEISKFIGVKYFLQNYRTGIHDNDCWFYGDAPNDESMFELFHNSVGVSNISHCLHKLNFRPRIILQGPENAGPLGVLAHIQSVFASK